MIKAICLNYLRFSTPSNEGRTKTIVETLRRQPDAIVRKQIEGHSLTQSRPVVQRVQTPGPITFARGLAISVLLDETAFEGFGIFILGSVLEQFFTRYVSLNSFTETVIKSQQRGEVMRWKPRIGRRHLI